LARPSSRDAIATISVKVPACMAGMTCFAAIWAVLKTPHLTFFDTGYSPLQRLEKRCGAVGTRREAKWQSSFRIRRGNGIWLRETVVALGCRFGSVHGRGMIAPTACE
jgi:hypothetical protein